MSATPKTVGDLLGFVFDGGKDTLLFLQDGKELQLQYVNYDDGQLCFGFEGPLSEAE